jgi:hypothetical protein
MTTAFRKRLALVPILAAAVGAWAYSVITGPNGNPTTFDDGTVSFTVRLGAHNSSAQAAIEEWNAVLGRLQLSPVLLAVSPATEANSQNELAFDSTIFGDEFGANVLAVTVSYRSSVPRSNGTNRRVESDIIFNTAYTWGSYRGARQPGMHDLRRVTLHELGHALGLNHPDEAGQSVSAVMNSTISDIDALQPDDVSGGQSLYGAPTVVIAPSIVSHPASTSVVSSSVATFTVSASGSTPLSYQWQSAAPNVDDWNNLTGNGQGQTSTTLHYYPNLADNGRRLRCVVSNSAGSATSNPATVTVTGSAPSLSLGPSPQTVVFSTNGAMSAYFNGSAPLSYIWQVLAVGSSTWLDLAEGGFYTGTRTNTLQFVAPPQSLNGNSYRCVATNPLGSATSGSAVLTVVPATPPVITYFPPSSLTLDYGQSFAFSASVSGLPYPTLQWKKDGVAIPGATSTFYSKSLVTEADAGTYTLTATNVAGGAIGTVTVVVRAALGPVITTQPTGVEVARGNTFMLNVTATGSMPLSYQWYRNEQPIAGATATYYTVWPANWEHSGQYKVRVSNPAGTVTSSTVEVVVLPPPLPEVTLNSGWTGHVGISPGGSLAISANTTGLISTYQWFKDGAPIPGATSANLLKSPVTSADAGEYALQVTNESGLVMSSPVLVVWKPTSRPWLDARRLGNVVYFVATQPGRIMRYDLERETWLPQIYLPEAKVPTAFLPTASGVVIAYGRELVRRSLTDQTEVSLYQASALIPSLTSYGRWVYFADTTSAQGTHVVGIDLSTGAVIGRYAPFWPLQASSFQRPVPLAVSSTGIGISVTPGSPEDLARFQFGVDGSLPSTGGRDTPYHGTYPVGGRQYFTPDESAVIDSSGLIFRVSDMTFQQALGATFDDLAFAPDGAAVVLRGRSLRLYTAGTWAESGEVLMPTPGGTVMAFGSDCFVFSGDSTSANPAVRKVARSDFRVPEPRDRLDPAFTRFSVDDAFVDAAGALNLVSRSVRGIVRWDPSTRAFLPTRPLRGNPRMWSYAPAVQRLALVHADGALTDIDLSVEGEETVQTQIGTANRLQRLTALDRQTWLNLQSSGSTGDFILTLRPDGSIAGRTAAIYNDQAVLWQSTGRRVYLRGAFESSDNLFMMTVPESGAVPTARESGSQNLPSPLRWNSDETLILSGNGRIVNADLQSVAQLPNAVGDGAWTASSLFTVRARPQGTQIQKWARVTYSSQGSALLAGLPLRIFRLSETSLLVLTLVDGYVTMHLVSPDSLAVTSMKSNAPGTVVNNRAPTASLTLSEQRTLGQALTVTVDVGDPDGNFAYANLWVHTPSRGWLAVRADNTQLSTSAISPAHAVATLPGRHRREFLFTPTDGAGVYTFALAAMDAAGARANAANQSIVVAPPVRPPRAEFELSGQPMMGSTLTVRFNVDDEDGNFAYANLWVKTPNRGWMAIRADNATVATDTLGADHAAATSAGTFSRTFTFTAADGTGAYMFALAAVDAAGEVAFATNQYAAVTTANRPPAASLTLSSERALGQTITITGNVTDEDGNFAYANLWVKTPNRGWMAIRADNATVATDTLGADHAAATSAGTFSRTFTFTAADGTGAYMFALAAVDAAGEVSFAANQYLTVVSQNQPPTVALTMAGQGNRVLGDVLVIKVTAADADGNFAYGNLWIKSPNRGWVAIKSDSTTVVTGALGAAHATTTVPGADLTRTFALTTADGVGDYIIAFAGVDTAGAVAFADNLYFTAVPALHNAMTEQPSSYEAWARMHFNAEELADPGRSGPDAVHGDAGISNLLRYALGLDATEDGTGALPEISSLGENWFLTYRRLSAVSDLVYRVEVSFDLTNWTAAGVTHEPIFLVPPWETWQAHYVGYPGQAVYMRLVPQWEPPRR